MTLPHSEVPLVYSLHYVQQGRKDSGDELPPETMGRMKKQESGKSKFHAEEDFPEKQESMNLHPRRNDVMQKYHQFLGALPLPLSCKKLVQTDLKLKPELERSLVRQRPYPAPQDQIDGIERQI